MTSSGPSWSAYRPNHHPRLSPASGGRGRVVLLIATEAARAEGWAAEIALGLARSWSGIGADVLLIDADPVEPTLHRLAHIENGAGISDALLFGSSIGGMAEPVEDGRFRVVPAGSPLADPVGAFERPRWRELVEDLVARDTMVVIFSRADAEWLDALTRLADDLVLIALPDDAGIPPLSGDERLRAIYGIGTPDDDPDEEWIDPLASDPLEAAPAVPAPREPESGHPAGIDPAPLATPPEEDEPDMAWEDVDLGPTRIPLAAFGEALADADAKLEAAETAEDPATEPEPPTSDTMAFQIDPLDDMVWEDPPEDVVPAKTPAALQDPDAPDSGADPLAGGSGGEAPGWDAVDEAIRQSTPDVPMGEAPAPTLDLEDPWEQDHSSRRSRRLPAFALAVAAIGVAGWFFWPAAQAGPATATESMPPAASNQAEPPPATSESTGARAQIAAPADPSDTTAGEAQPPATVSVDPEASLPMRYAAAFGAFRSPEAAQRLRDEVAGQAEEVLVLVVPAEVNGQLYYRVLAGAAPTGTESREMMDGLALATGRSADDLVLRDVPMGFLMDSTDGPEPALQAAATLRAEGLPAYVLGGGAGPGAYRVMVGAFLDSGEASWLRERLESSGHAAELVERVGRPVLR